MLSPVTGRLGPPAGDEGPLLVDAVTGARVGPDGLRGGLGRARLTRVSLEANGGVCRGMLRGRYGDAPGRGERPDDEGTFVPLALLTVDADRETNR